MPARRNLIAVNPVADGAGTDASPFRHAAGAAKSLDDIRNRREFDDLAHVVHLIHQK